MTKHIFIIRFWREYRDLEQTESVLRGFIQHVPTGKKHFLTDFNSILEFVTSFLPESGAGFSFIKHKQSRGSHSTSKIDQEQVSKQAEMRWIPPNS